MAKSTTKPAEKRSAATSKTVKSPDNTNASPIAPGKDLSIEDLFLGGIKDMYWAENHLVKAIPKMIAAAAGEELRQALTDHLEVTRGHVGRLEQVFELLSENPLAKKCDAVEGLTMSGEHVIEQTPAGTTTRDTGIIMSGLKVENFEATAYKGLIRLAEKTGKADIASLLQANLDEETEAEEKLQALSEKTLTNEG